jgi:hypothetical protein
VLLQLALPSLRVDRALRAFRTTYERNGCDLAAWRKAAYLPKKDTGWLDDHDGAGARSLHHHHHSSHRPTAPPQH